MVIKMIKMLENKMEEMQESVIKDLEELKNKHAETNNKITEIKNTTEGLLTVFLTIIAACGLPWWLSGKESTCQCRRCGFNPWVRKIPWRRKWQPTPVFWPGESQGRGSLVGCHLWGHRELDMTEVT